MNKQSNVDELTKLVKACQVIKNEKTLEIFGLIEDLNCVSRKQLVNESGFIESPLTKALSKLESADLISSVKTGREKELEISSYGRRITEAMGRPIPLEIPYVLSDVNRIFILEAIDQEHRSYDKIFWGANDLLKKYDMQRINPSLVTYHMRTLKVTNQITAKTPYRLTPEGKSTVKIVDSIVGQL